jgi:hypothetical protein
MRATCWAIVGLTLMPSSAAAQDGLRSASLPERTPASPVSRPMTMPSASLPDRTPTNPIPPARDDQFLAGPHTYTNHPRRRPLPFYGSGYAPFYYDAATEERTARQERGFLHLDVRPGAAHVHVDGFYVGTVDEFRSMVPGRPLAAGPHRIELTAPGHAPVTFEVLIAPDQTITYRRDLEPTASGPQQPRDTPAVLPPPTPAKAKTFYVIPGCYAGDKPPGNRRLPAGCDVLKLRTIPPAVTVVARR